MSKRMDEKRISRRNKFTEYLCELETEENLVSRTYGRLPFTFRGRDFGSNYQFFGSGMSEYHVLFQWFQQIGRPQTPRFLVSTFTKCRNVITIKDHFDCYFNKGIKFAVEQFPVQVGRSSCPYYVRLLKQNLNFG